MLHASTWYTHHGVTRITVLHTQRARECAGDGNALESWGGGGGGAKQNGIWWLGGECDVVEVKAVSETRGRQV